MLCLSNFLIRKINIRRKKVTICMEYIDRKELSARFIDSFHTFNSNFFQKISYPIAANHWISLCILDSYGPLTATALGNHLSISKQQVLQIINKLCRDGYISRQTALSDRRYKNIILTEKGHKIIMNEIRLLTMVFENKIDILADLELTKFDEAIKTFVPLFEKIYIINKGPT